MRHTPNHPVRAIAIKKAARENYVGDCERATLFSGGASPTAVQFLTRHQTAMRLGRLKPDVKISAMYMYGAADLFAMLLQLQWHKS